MNEETLSRFHRISLLKKSLESLYCDDGEVTTRLFKRQLREYHELVSTDLSDTFNVSISIDELFNITKYYKNSPTTTRWGLFRPLAQRVGSWSEEYEYDFLLGYFLGNIILSIKCGISTDRPYQNAAFVYDQQHRMLSATSILNGTRKINKEKFAKRIKKYCNDNDIGVNEHVALVELQRWMDETNNDELDFNYVIENEDSYPFISLKKSTKINLEFTLATEKVLRRTILFKMNHHPHEWSTFRHIASAIYSDGNETLLRSLIQNNTDNTEWFKVNVGKELPSLLCEDNTHFRSCLRTHEGDRDKLESFCFGFIFGCIDDESESSKIQLDKVYITHENLRDHLLLEKEVTEHFPYQTKIKRTVDAAYETTDEYVADISKAIVVFRKSMKWINDNISSFQTYNKELKDGINKTMSSLIGNMFCGREVTKKNYKALPKHTKRFSLSQEDTSHVFFAYFRKLTFENADIDVDVLGNSYLSNFQKILLSFVENVESMSELESLYYSYEKRIPYTINFCKLAYEQTTESLK